MNSSDVTKVLPPSRAEGNPLKIDGDLSLDGTCTSAAIPFKGENADLFIRLLDWRRAQRGTRASNPVDGGT